MTIFDWLKSLSDYYSTYPALSRIPAGLMLVVLGLVGAVGGFVVTRTLRAQGNMFTWHYSARHLIWWIPAVGAVSLVLCILLGLTEQRTGFFAGLTAIRALDLVLPIFAGVHAAVTFSTEEEPCLEAHLTYPRSVVWLALERITLSLVIFTVIGVAGSTWVIALKGGDLWRLMLNWLPPMILSVGVGVRVSYSSKQVIFGAMAAIVVAYGSRWVMDSLLMGYPYLWPLNPYLQPLNPIYFRPGMYPITDYHLNRWVITLIGIAFLVSGLNTLRNAEALVRVRASH
jgi:hypothetical protein